MMPRSTKLILLLLTLASVLSLRATSAQQRVRKLAPGVLTTIRPEPKPSETFQGPIPLPTLTRLGWDPHYTPKNETLAEMAMKTVLRRNIWNLEFSFKPLRMVNVDIPQPDGRMRRKLIWYMVYRVRNLGGHLAPVAEKDDFDHVTYTTAEVDEVLNVGATEPTGSIRFFPHFVLKIHEEDKEYLDRVIPAAIPVIQMREMRGAKLYNSVEISRVNIKVATPEADDSVWGVVTWQDVDPRTDYFSIYVQGLTNASRAERTARGLILMQKTLKLNFWRPGDVVYEHEGEIRYGVPAVTSPAEQAAILSIYNLRERLDHLWVYR
jgi:hypothetical protein